jgi:hypothetical protein
MIYSTNPPSETKEYQAMLINQESVVETETCPQKPMKTSNHTDKDQEAEIKRNLTRLTFSIINNLKFTNSNHNP